MEGRSALLVGAEAKFSSLPRGPQAPLQKSPPSSPVGENLIFSKRKAEENLALVWLSLL